jgi:TetR/AcrR family transcriptional regulator
MPKIVDKEERMKTILMKAMEVFSEVGYKDSNLTLIAEKCSLSRPTVYQYFKDKKEIYYYAVKLVSSEMFALYSKMAFDDEGGDEIERLDRIISDVFEKAGNNSQALSNLVEFILAEKRSGVDVYSAIMARTAKLRILIKRLLLQGVHRGTIRECDVDRLGEEVYSLIQAECFQVGFFNSYTPLEARQTLLDFLSSFRK